MLGTNQERLMDRLVDLFTTQGRANRAWYLWHVVLDDAAIFTAGISIFALAGVLGMPFLALPGFGVIAAGVWAAICITIKRLHDLDRPGWHGLLFLIPLYNLYLSCVLLFVKGTEGANQFGADPLQAAKVLD